MSIKILTKNSIDNTNIDGARANHFSAGMRSGIVKGAYNEGRLFTPASNKIALDSCELRISGHQVIIDSVEQIELQNAPSQATRMSVIAEIKVDDSSVPSFRLFVQNQNVSLIQDNLFKTNNGSGTYQLRIGNFTLGTTGLISDVIRTADIITGGGEGGIADIKFNATATQLSSSSQPEVNADYNEETKEWDLHFGIPAGGGTNVTIGGVVQSNWDADRVYELSNPNILINGDLRVNQRGQTSYSVNGYTVDRWRASSNSLTVKVVPTGISLSGGTRVRFFYQIIENIKDLIGKTVTFSIRVKGVSGLNGKLNLYDKTRDTTLSGYVFAYTGDYQTVSYTATIPSNFESLAVLIYMNNGSTATADEVFVDWAKLEIGSVPTPFSPRPYAEELAMCQRYNVDLIRNTTGYPYVAMGFARNETQLFVVLNLPQAMRVRPTTFVYGGLYLNGSNKTNEQITSSNIAFGGIATNGNQISLTITTTGLIAGQCYALQLRDNGHIGIDAEM